MKIAIIGAYGQLGMDICYILEKKGLEIVRLDKEQIDISKKEQVFDVLGKIKPNVVINTAAFHNVPKCEQNLETSFEVNTFASKYLAEAANQNNFYLIHISTDYVFDGKKNIPYIESDLAKPLNVYANSKLAGEKFIESIAERYLILRVSGIYGKNPCRAKGGRNFVELMIKLAKERDELRVVDDEILTPTSTLEIARQIYQLIDTKPVGIAHATAEGKCSWYEFAKEIFEIKKIEVNLNKAKPGEFDTGELKRPKYSVLENKFLKDRNLNNFKHWKEGLKEYLLKSR